MEFELTNYNVAVQHVSHYATESPATVSKIKLATVVKSDSKAPFLIATTPRCREGTTPFPELLDFTLDPYLIMLGVKQGSIKYHFLSLWYDDLGLNPGLPGNW